MAYSLSDLISLAIFTLGAVTFSILTAFYWVERRRRGAGASTVFAAFTLVCAAAFLNSLFFQVLHAGVVLIFWRDLSTGLVAPLIAHLVYETESSGVAKRGYWRAALVLLYAATLLALTRSFASAGLFVAPWTEELYSAPALILAASAACGIAMQASSRRPVDAGARMHRRLMGGLLLLMFVCAIANFSGFGALTGQLPDYLLLAFFCVSLYYRERLVFFDVLMKRGAFLAVGLTAMVLVFSFRLSAAWTLWPYAGGLLLFWLAGPLVYASVAHVIDRVWLRRPYSPAEAERQFLREIQAAVSEEDLRTRATASLTAIFQASAEVGFTDIASSVGEDCLMADLEQQGTRSGHVRLAPRHNGIPFLSDDRRLLQSLASALGVVLENVRFRVERTRQMQREQELRWLASRAELKALRAQINPHFLFNALSVIAGLMQYQPELADETIERLAQVFRYTLRRSENEWATLGEEIDFIAAYLKIEQARFGDRLRVGIEVEPGAAEVAIPAMSIQPLIENAVKHGISEVEGGGSVTVRASVSEDMMTVEVVDSGSGFPQGFSLEAPGEGHGLRNVTERLRGYYGDGARLSCRHEMDGTHVAMTVPCSAAATVGEAKAEHARIDR